MEAKFLKIKQRCSNVLLLFFVSVFTATAGQYVHITLNKCLLIFLGVELIWPFEIIDTILMQFLTQK